MRTMDRYYYFVSQLPFLKFNERTYLNREDFLTEAKKWLVNRDFAILSQTDINDFYPRRRDPSVLKEYKNFEKTLREGLRVLRKASGEDKKYRPFAFLRTILREGSPLDIEKKLLELRWKFIEEKEIDHFFDLEFLILYFLKLQILERLFTFDKDKGTARFDALCEVGAKV